ncbi:anion permease [Pseudodesulfovibrio tunisiensis]|uniref:anion permease n=1 Tax=Pseudodesulfovibrio tunisiensis TaxID=463192 RepID=UPI001FB44B12|nr:anion permease [Pseudodesulfovibrio tunisiensis]
MKLDWKMVLPVALGGAVALFPAPSGLPAGVWYYFALFVSVIVALILEPIPAAAVGLIGVTLGAVLRLVPVSPGEPVSTGQALQWALSGFSNSTVWLIFAAFMFARGYENTGLGRRIGLVLIKALGRRTLGMGYAVAFADLVLAPFTPSNTARSGGTIYPIIRNIPELYGSTPDNEPRKMGGYLMWTALASTCVTSSMFFTGLAPNLLALTMVQDVAGVNVTWMEWFRGFLPVGAVLFLSTPFMVYCIYPPTQRHSPEAPAWAGAELDALGCVTPRELLMMGLILFALAMWMFGGAIMSGTTVAMVVLCLMVLTGILSWDDVIGNRKAWNVLVWFATLVTMAGGLARTGFLKWFADNVAFMLSDMAPLTIIMLLVTLFFVSHYLFASITAHVTALLPVFLAAAVAIPDLPIKPFAMLLCFTLGIMGVITPFATGPSPIYYGSGYVSRKEFWVLGLIFGVMYLAVLLVLGVPYVLRMFG